MTIGVNIALVVSNYSLTVQVTLVVNFAYVFRNKVKRKLMNVRGPKTLRRKAKIKQPKIMVANTNILIGNSV